MPRPIGFRLSRLGDFRVRLDIDSEVVSFREHESRGSGTTVMSATISAGYREADA